MTSEAKNDTDKKTESIRKFLLDIDCLNALNPWKYGVNFFEISGIISKEIKHSKVLAWLFDANGNHGMSDNIIRKFLQRVIADNVCEINDDNITDVIDISLMDFSSFTVKTEYRNIDILLVSERERTVIVIENKIYAGERTDGSDGGQLKKYSDIIAGEYSGYRKMFVFLTREGDAPSDFRNWYSADYSMIADIAEQILSEYENIQTDVKIIVLHYVKTLRRNLIVDKRLQEICKEIYNKHREALDLIYDNRPDNVSEIAETASAIIVENGSALGLKILDDISTKKRVRFTSDFINAYVPETDDTSFGWHTGHGFLYDLECKDVWIGFSAYVLNDSDDVCNKIYEFTQDKYKRYGIKRSTKLYRQTVAFRYTLLVKDEIAAYDDVSSDKNVKRKLENEINLLIKKIAEFESDLKNFL